MDKGKELFSQHHLALREVYKNILPPIQFLILNKFIEHLLLATHYSGNTVVNKAWIAISTQRI